MQSVSPALARYLQEQWAKRQGGLSHAAKIFLSLEESEKKRLVHREEIICTLQNGMAYTGVLDKQGRALCVRLETAERAAHLPCWDYLAAGLPPVLVLRLNAQLTQTQLAQRAGCTQKDISRWETGARNPTPKTLERLRRAAEREI